MKYVSHKVQIYSQDFPYHTHTFDVKMVVVVVYSQKVSKFAIFLGRGMKSGLSIDSEQQTWAGKPSA